MLSMIQSFSAEIIIVIANFFSLLTANIVDFKKLKRQVKFKLTILAVRTRKNLLLLNVMLINTSAHV